MQTTNIKKEKLNDELEIILEKDYFESTKRTTYWIFVMEKLSITAQITIKCETLAKANRVYKTIKNDIYSMATRNSDWYFLNT